MQDIPESFAQASDPSQLIVPTSFFGSMTFVVSSGHFRGPETSEAIVWPIPNTTSTIMDIERMFIDEFGRDDLYFFRGCSGTKILVVESFLQNFPRNFLKKGWQNLIVE